MLNWMETREKIYNIHRCTDTIYFECHNLMIIESARTDWISISLLHLRSSNDLPLTFVQILLRWERETHSNTTEKKNNNKKYYYNNSKSYFNPYSFLRLYHSWLISIVFFFCSCRLYTILSGVLFIYFFISS